MGTLGIVWPFINQICAQWLQDRRRNYKNRILAASPPAPPVVLGNQFSSSVPLPKSKEEVPSCSSASCHIIQESEGLRLQFLSNHISPKKTTPIGPSFCNTTVCQIKFPHFPLLVYNKNEGSGSNIIKPISNKQLSSKKNILGIQIVGKGQSL